MKLKLPIIVVIGCLLSPLASIAQSSVAPAASVAVAGWTNALIPWSELGARAGADYKGDGLAVTPNGEGAEFGARLVLGNSGRKIAYSRLHVVDAKGHELSARIEVHEPSLCVFVDDTDAIYPIHIDPTFSDANWISLGGIPGANSVDIYPVNAVAVDGSGNVYIGGIFEVVGDTLANNIAKWDGNRWSALGSGIPNGGVSALAVSGSDVYVGGSFLGAGGIAATNIAKWDGSA